MAVSYYCSLYSTVAQLKTQRQAEASKKKKQKQTTDREAEGEGAGLLFFDSCLWALHYRAKSLDSVSSTGTMSVFFLEVEV